MLAALVEFDAGSSDLADLWTHADGRPYADDEAALITSATIAEWELAEGLRVGPEPLISPDPDAAAVAGLLRLASDSPAATVLALGLRGTFVPVGGQPHRALPHQAARALADLFRRLALPALSGGDLDRATSLLNGL